MSDKFNPSAGDQVYGIHGQAAYYVGRVTGGHAVEPIYEEDDGRDGPSERLDDVCTWREVFAKPPRARLDGDIAELESEISAKRKELREIQAEVQTADEQARLARQRIRSNADLVDLDLWLQGKITHIVTLEYGTVSIGTVDEVLTKNEDHGRTSLRLLSLRVDPKAERYWVGYAGYSDGSGGQKRCRLATSLEHARQLAAEWVAIELKTNSNYKADLGRTAIAAGVEVSQDVREAAEKQARERHESRVKSAKAEFEKAKAALALIEATP